MDRKRIGIMLKVLLCGLWLAAGLVKAFGEKHRVTEKEKAVVKNGGIDYADEEATNPDYMTEFKDAQGKVLIRIISKTFLPPEGWKFKVFKELLVLSDGTKKPTHVDIWANPEGLDFYRQKDTATEVQIQGAFPVPRNAGNFPLRGEGNLTPPRPPGPAAPPDFHWAAKVLDFKLLILFQTAKMREAGIPPKAILAPEYEEVGVLVGDTIEFSAKMEPDLGLSPNEYVWSGTRSGTGTSIFVTFRELGTNPETITLLGVSQTVNTVVITVPPPNLRDWVLANLDVIFHVRLYADTARAWADANQRALGGGFHNGKADAARHAYWNVCMAATLGQRVAEGASTAYERSNIEARGAALQKRCH